LWDSVVTGERRYGIVLHGVEGVDDEAVGEEVLPPQIDHEGVHGVGAVLDRFDEVGAAQRHAAQEPDGLRQVPELAGGGLVEPGHVEQGVQLQRREVRRAEDVARDAELGGDLERPRAQDVRDESRDTGGGRGEQGAEEVA